MRARERLHLRELQWHLDQYRQARRTIALQAARRKASTVEQDHDVSLHAIGIAEELDRLADEVLL